MDIRSFAQGLEQAPLAIPRSEQTEWRYTNDDLMRPVKKWGYFFNNVLENYLTSSPTDQKATEIALEEYTGNANRSLMQNISIAAESVAYIHPDFSRSLNYLNFHTINLEVAPFWRRIITPESEPISRAELHATQTRLAIAAMRLVASRQEYFERLQDDHSTISDSHLLLDRSFAGRITELDASVALLEMLKQRTQNNGDNTHDMVVVPAPPKFETSGARAADLLLLDVRQAQIRGLQVKTGHVNPSDYDLSFVDIINGRTDLDNVQKINRYPGISAQIPRPGLLSADFLLNNETLTPLTQASRTKGLEHITGPLEYAKSVAKGFMPGIDYPHRAARAAAKLGARLLNTLYATS